MAKQGIYTSNPIKAAENILMWGTISYSGENLTQDVQIICYTRASQDQHTWSGWAPLINNIIASPPYPFLQYKIEVTCPDELDIEIHAVNLDYITTKNNRVRIRSQGGPWVCNAETRLDGSYNKVRIKAIGQQRNSAWVRGIR